jgi:hypothetical protein
LAAFPVLPTVSAATTPDFSQLFGKETKLDLCQSDVGAGTSGVYVITRRAPPIKLFDDVLAQY